MRALEEQDSSLSQQIEEVQQEAAARLHGELGARVLVRTVVPYFGNVELLPPSWMLCDGSPVTDPESPMVGESVPNLKGRFVRGAINHSELGGEGGLEEHSQGYHKHGVPEYTDGRVRRQQSGDWLAGSPRRTQLDGGFTFDNRPPFVNLHYIIKIKCGPVGRNVQYRGCLNSSDEHSASRSGT